MLLIGQTPLAIIDMEHLTACTESNPAPDGLQKLQKKKLPIELLYTTNESGISGRYI